MKTTPLRYLLAASLLLSAASSVVQGAQTGAALQGLNNNAASIHEQCLSQIDQAINLAETSASAAATRHQQLEASCSTVPQLWHNKAVFEFENGDWDLASRYLEKALELDARASQSLQQLRSIYSHQAALAYRQALDSKGTPPRRPQLNLQGSTQRNARLTQWQSSGVTFPPLPPTVESTETSAATTNTDSLSLVATPDVTFAHTSTVLAVEQSVLRWWNAQIEKERQVYQNAYTADARQKLQLLEKEWIRDPREDLSVKPAWHELDINVELFSGHAVVVMRYSGNKAFQPRLLLLSAQENVGVANSDWKVDWKIFRETHL